MIAEFREVKSISQLDNFEKYTEVVVYLYLLWLSDAMSLSSKALTTK